MERGEEVRKISSKRRESRVKPFVISKDGYQYFDMGRIAANMEVSESKAEEAKKMIAENRIILDKVDIGYHHFSRDDNMSGVAYGYITEQKGTWQITCMFDKNAILRADCGVPGCSYYYTSYSIITAVCDFAYYAENTGIHLKMLLTHFHGNDTMKVERGTTDRRLAQLYLL